MFNICYLDSLFADW